MYCPHCFRANPSPGSLCKRCGVELKSDAPAQTTSIPGLTMAVQEGPGYVVVHVVGTVDKSTMTVFETATESLKAKGVPRFVFDMSELTYINSQGCHLLVNLSDWAKSKGGTLVCTDLADRVKAIFDLVDPKRALLRIAAALEDAVKEFRPASPEPKAGPKVTTTAGLILSDREDERLKLVVVHIAGSVDKSTVDTFQRHLDAIPARGVWRIVLALQDLKFINSSGLRFLIALSDLVRQRKGGLYCVAVPKRIKAVFDLLDPKNDFIQVRATVDDARKDLSKPR